MWGIEWGVGGWEDVDEKEIVGPLHKGHTWEENRFDPYSCMKELKQKLLAC